MNGQVRESQGLRATCKVRVCADDSKDVIRHTKDGHEGEVQLKALNTPKKTKKIKRLLETSVQT